MQDSEKRIYYEIVTKCWAAFSRGRPSVEFSDEWWKEVIADFNEIGDGYKNTEFYDFVGGLIMQFLNQHERRSKNGTVL